MRTRLLAVAIAVASSLPNRAAADAGPQDAEGTAESFFRLAAADEDEGAFAHALDHDRASVAAAPESVWARRASDRIAWLEARSEATRSSLRSMRCATHGATYASVRGFDGAGAAERAIERLVAAGVPVGVNVVLTRTSFPRLRETLERARSLGAREAQLLRYKPAGRAASLDYLASRLSEPQARALPVTLRSLTHAFSEGGAFRLRIDCALVPFLSGDDDLTRDPERLARLGVFGCEAGGALAAITATGKVAPCSFAEATALAGADLAHGHTRDPDLTRWRAWNAVPPEPCRSCPIRAVCKGGCKVVASFVDGAHGPDPECPRVIDHRRVHAP